MQQLENGGPSSMGDDEALTKFEDVGDAFPQHEECVAILTMKCGEPLMAVRKKLHDEIPITFIPEEGFGVFQSKVERHYGKIGPNYVQEKRAIYLKPSSNATQSKYVQLTKENFDPLLRVRWKVARSMKVELKYEVFCYFVDITTKKEKKRLSMKMFQQQQQLLPESPSGDMLANGMGFAPAPGAPSSAFPLASALSQAMQGYSDVAAPVLGESASKKSKRGSGSSGNGDDSDRPRKSARGARGAADVIDVGQAESEAQQQQQQAPVFHMIPFRINGFVVPLEMDVTALRRSLGLLQAPPVNAADAAVAAAAAAAAAAVGDLDATPSGQQYDR